MKQLAFILLILPFCSFGQQSAPYTVIEWLGATLNKSGEEALEFNVHVVGVDLNSSLEGTLVGEDAYSTYVTEGKKGHVKYRVTRTQGEQSSLHGWVKYSSEDSVAWELEPRPSPKILNVVGGLLFRHYPNPIEVEHFSRNAWGIRAQGCEVNRISENRFEVRPNVRGSRELEVYEVTSGGDTVIVGTRTFKIKIVPRPMLMEVEGLNFMSIDSVWSLNRSFKVRWAADFLIPVHYEKLDYIMDSAMIFRNGVHLTTIYKADSTHHLSKRQGEEVQLCDTLAVVGWVRYPGDENAVELLGLHIPGKFISYDAGCSYDASDGLGCDLKNDEFIGIVGGRKAMMLQHRLVKDKEGFRIELSARCPEY